MIKERATQSRLAALVAHSEVSDVLSADVIDTLEDLAELHEAWHAAEPSSGHDAEAGRYRRRLEESGG